MHLLFVGMAHSSHTAKWVRMVAATGRYAVSFVSVAPVPLHALLADVAVHSWSRPQVGGPVHVFSPAPRPQWRRAVDGALRVTVGDDWRRVLVEQAIKRLRPDLVHALELQAAGYWTVGAQAALQDAAAPMVFSNYGSDVYLYGGLRNHRALLRPLHERAAGYVAECARDLELAHTHGLARDVPSLVVPNSGGLDLSLVQRLRALVPPARRRLVLVKGYQTFAGRAFVALRAIERAADALGGVPLRVVLPSDIVRIEVERVAQRTGLDLVALPDRVPHGDMLALFSQARVSLAVSISDAASTSFLEALSLGVFPIQTNTACAEEWVRDGEGAFLVAPDDEEGIAERLVRAVRDDDLVARAADANAVLLPRLDERRIAAQVDDFYQRVGASLSGAARRRPA
jgi:glycosyltransferase involved in cell wall biosynthesis